MPSLGTHGIVWDGQWSPPLLLNFSAVAIAEKLNGSATSREVAESIFGEADLNVTIDELATVVDRVAATLGAHGLLEGSRGYGLDAAAQMLPSDPNT